MERYTVSSSPHIRSNESVSRIMLDVVLALIPAGIAGTIFFGTRVILVMAVSIGFAVTTEAIIQRLCKKSVTTKDFSAVLTGLLLAYNLPPSIPLWMAALGSILAVALVKQAFGGLGQNFMNPALGARAILVTAWPKQMTTWTLPGADAVSGATPLALIKGTEGVLQSLPSMFDAFIGNIGGCIGETSALALLLGAAYLMIRKVINWRIPITYIGTVAFFTWMLGGESLFTGNGIYNILLGGLMIGAFYMATDYSSSPITGKGQLIMGFGCGILTSLIRLYGGYPEGVSYSILIMNIATPLIDKYTTPKVYGEVGKSV